MPAPAPTPASAKTAQPYSPFQERLVVYLLPYFLPLTENFELARAEVLETLASYGARTRAEMINAARIIAFSFGALELLSEAKGDEMPYPLRLRTRACANSLNRSSQQDERALAKRLACDEPDANGQTDEQDAEAAAGIDQARAAIDRYRNRLSAARSATAAAPNPAHKPWSSPILANLARAMPPPRPAAT